MAEIERNKLMNEKQERDMSSIPGSSAGAVPQCYSPRMALLHQLDRQIGECLDRAQRLRAIKNMVECEKEHIADLLLQFQGLIVTNRA